MVASTTARGRRAARPTAPVRPCRSWAALGSSATASALISRPGRLGQNIAVPKSARQAGMKVIETAAPTTTARAMPGPKAWKKPSWATMSDALPAATMRAAVSTIPWSSAVALSAARSGACPSASRCRNRERKKIP